MPFPLAGEPARPAPPDEGTVGGFRARWSCSCWLCWKLDYICFIVLTLVLAGGGGAQHQEGQLRANRLHSTSTRRWEEEGVYERGKEKLQGGRE